MEDNKVCSICRKNVKEPNSIVILGQTVCHDCEMKIVQTSVSDEKYDQLKNDIKRILSKTAINAKD